MSDETSAPVAEAAVSYALPADAPAEMSVSDAARMLAQARRARQEQPTAESAEPAPAVEPELAVEANADPAEVPGEVETQEADPADDLPPIEPPRSWTKEEKEAFKTWPREAQESTLRVTSAREAEFRRSQNEAAEAKRVLETRMAQADEVRKQYEAKLPALAQAIETTLQNEFSDIQSMADLRKMQAEDPFRYQQWDLRQKELAFVKQEQLEADRRQQAERQTKFAEFVNKENLALNEKVPDFADATKGPELSKKLVEYLRSEAVGLTDQELGSYANGEKISPLDHRLQVMAVKAMRYDELQKAPPKAIPKPLPPVNRPGTAKGGNPSVALQIQTLNTQLSQATGNEALRIAARLTNLKRAAGTR